MLTARAFIEDVETSVDARGSGIENAVIQFELEGRDTKIFHYRIRKGCVKAFPGYHVKPDVVIRATLDTWAALVEGRLRPVRAYVSGEVSVQGDIVMAQKAFKLFQKGERCTVHPHSVEWEGKP